MTHKPTDINLCNRTGIQASPQDWRDTADSAIAGTPDGALDVGELTAMRVELGRSMEPVGSMPAPLTLKGMAETAVKGLQGEHLAVFMDLLGERIAFERMGVRLYDALLCKHAAAELTPTEPRLQELEQLRDQELDHLALLVAMVEQLGGDPTAITPASEVMTVASRGLAQVLLDPRTTFTQGMRTMLTAELTDCSGWETVAAVAEALGKQDLAQGFRRALREEEEHVLKMKNWLVRTLQGQAA